MNTARTKLKILGLVALCLVGCAAGRAPSAPAVPAATASNEMQITGALTKRGSQMESFWGVRDTSRPDGKLWRLETTNASITEQLTRLGQQTVRVTGELVADSAQLFPVLRILKIEPIAQ